MSKRRSIQMRHALPTRYMKPLKTSCPNTSLLKRLPDGSLVKYQFDDVLNPWFGQLLLSTQFHPGGPCMIHQIKGAPE